MLNRCRNEVLHGDCLSVLKEIGSGSVDLAYLDPPFFTQRSQRLLAKDRMQEYSFDDIWSSHKDYADFLHSRLKEVYRVVCQTGSIFVHCDRKATHIVRALLDEIFGTKMFLSEIIWHYRRWSNSRRSLLPSHQTIYYYSKTDEYTFNEVWQEYSPSTNVDQILQQRSRDVFGKSVYKRDQFGSVVPSGEKKGVPLGDVWDIPFLNPKARERTGYPTQKPLTLLERIISLSTNEGDTVLDPFCGSGTTLVAANLLGRNAIGIDISREAVQLTRQRLRNPIRSESSLLIHGRDTYRNSDEALLALLRGLDHVPVQRNSGIDAILKKGLNGAPVPIRVQRENETVQEAAIKLHKAAKTKSAHVMFLIATVMGGEGFEFGGDLPQEVVVVDAPALSVYKHIDRFEDGDDKPVNVPN